jgi:hypothetical protein
MALSDQSTICKAGNALKVTTVSQSSAAGSSRMVTLARDGDDVSLAWREGAHDDLVLAVALAAWQVERFDTYDDNLPIVLGTPPRWARRRW